MARAIHLVISKENVNDRTFRGNLEWFIITVCVLAVCYVISNVVPFFDDLTGLIGASLVPIGCWNLPIIYFVLNDPKAIHWIEYPFLGLIFVLGLALAGIGTYSNLLNIIDSWSNYGSPFGCIILS